MPIRHVARLRAGGGRRCIILHRVRMRRAFIRRRHFGAAPRAEAVFRAVRGAGLVLVGGPVCHSMRVVRLRHRHAAGADDRRRTVAVVRDIRMAAKADCRILIDVPILREAGRPIPCGGVGAVFRSADLHGIARGVDAAAEIERGRITFCGDARAAGQNGLDAVHTADAVCAAVGGNVGVPANFHDAGESGCRLADRRHLCVFGNRDGRAAYGVLRFSGSVDHRAALDRQRIFEGNPHLRRRDDDTTAVDFQTVRRVVAEDGAAVILRRVVGPCRQRAAVYDELGVTVKIDCFAEAVCGDERHIAAVDGDAAAVKLHRRIAAPRNGEGPRPCKNQLAAAAGNADVHPVGTAGHNERKIAVAADRNLATPRFDARAFKNVIALQHERNLRSVPVGGKADLSVSGTDGRVGEGQRFRLRIPFGRAVSGLVDGVLRRETLAVPVKRVAGAAEVGRSRQRRNGKQRQAHAQYQQQRECLFAL